MGDGGQLFSLVFEAVIIIEVIDFEKTAEKVEGALNLWLDRLGCHRLRKFACKCEGINNALLVEMVLDITLVMVDYPNPFISI